MSPKRTIPRIVRDYVEASPERPFVTFRDLKQSPFEETVMGYGDLWMGASAFAEALQGLNRGARALLVMPIGTRLLQAHLGAQIAGAVPIIHSHPSGKVDHEVYLRHLGHVLDLLMPEVVITTHEYSHGVHAAHRQTQCLVVAEGDLPLRSNFESLAWQDIKPDEIAIIQHSSGSTGLQKGIALSHSMIQRQCECYARAIAVDTDRDCVCSWIPLYHDMGLFTTWFLPLLQGIRVAVIDPFEWVLSPGSFLKLIADHSGTFCWQPNFAYNLLATRVSDKEMDGVTLESMRAFISCSEPVRERSQQLFRDRFRAYGLREDALGVCYAMAENAFAVTSAGAPTGSVSVLKCDPVALSQNRVEPSSVGSVEVVSCGRPIEHCEVKIVDEQRISLPERRVGEVALRSEYMLREYFRNPEATSRAIDSESWYYTGDLGFLADGELYITGRKKDLLIVGGRNFYPQDIESICDGTPNAIPGRAVAIGVADNMTGTERIVVLVESHGASDPHICSALAQTIRLNVIEQLDCQVSEIHVVPHKWLLKTSSGKIARAPNLERFRKEFPPYKQEPAGEDRVPAETTPVSALALVAWCFVVALIAYLFFSLPPNSSWGVYAGF